MRFSGFGHTINRSIAFSAALLVGISFASVYSTQAQSADVQPGLRSDIFASRSSVAGRNFDLEQFRNGGSGDVRSNIGWSSGSSDASNAHWAEGQFVPYRLRFRDLNPGTSYTVVIGYDAFANGVHAIDYLGSYNATAKDVTACDGASSCGNPARSFPIPQDTMAVTNQVDASSRGNVSQASGAFTIWGGDISSARYLNFSRGDQRQISVTFVANAADPVLAWAGHIASAASWGSDGSASSAKGAFRMTVGGTGGGQQSSLSPNAIENIASVFIRKQVFTNDGTGSSPVAFPFTITNGLTTTSFSLVDDNLGPGADIFQADITVGFQPSIPVTITEGSTPGWSLLDITCSDAETPGLLFTASGNSISFDMFKGHTVTCLFSNSQLGVTAAPVSVAGRVITPDGSAIRGAFLTLTNLSTGESKTVMTNNFGYYSFANVSSEQVYNLTATSKRYRFVNASRTLSLLDNISGVDFVSR